MKKYRDDIAQTCHEIVKDGYNLGIINDAEMKEFEADCFVHEPEKSYNTKAESSVILEQTAPALV